MPILDQHLQRAADLHASDLHLASDSKVYARILGQLKPLSDARLSPIEAESIISEFLSPEQNAKLRETLEIDTSYTLPSGDRFRLNVFMERKGWGLVARHFGSRIASVEELNLPPILNRFAESHQGLILITGPGRSGKSTTAAALIDFINSHRDDHIITIEDPIEYIHPRKKCLVNQRAVGLHTDSFASALRGALREDPDIIVIGEMRDTETMTLALTAAETGHLVIGTLNTNSAAATISRVINLFPATERAQATTSLSEALVGIFSQRLVPAADGKRLIPAYEVLVNSLAVANVIVSNEFHKLGSILATGAKDGMLTLGASLKALAEQQLITTDQLNEMLAEEL